MASTATTPRRSSPAGSSVWADERTWEVSNDDAGDGAPKSYVLEMLPYPAASRTSAT